MKQKDLTFLADIAQVDWARLAAYIDGEGSITIASVRGARPDSRRVMYVNVAVANTDIRLLEWLRNTFGGTISKFRHKSEHVKWAQAYVWTVGSRHASALLDRCLPYFIIKREQAEIALAFQRTILTDRRYGCKGRPLELIAAQEQLRQDLSTLKGTSGRLKRSTETDRIQ
jgi:hypothetical protein